MDPGKWVMDFPSLKIDSFASLKRINANTAALYFLFFKGTLGVGPLLDKYSLDSDYNALSGARIGMDFSSLCYKW